MVLWTHKNIYLRHWYFCQRHLVIEWENTQANEMDWTRNIHYGVNECERCKLVEMKLISKSKREIERTEKSKYYDWNGTMPFVVHVVFWRFSCSVHISHRPDWDISLHKYLHCGCVGAQISYALFISDSLLFLTLKFLTCFFLFIASLWINKLFTIIIVCLSPFFFFFTLTY